MAVDVPPLPITSLRSADELAAPGPYPQNNGVTFEYPAVPMILQRFEQDPDGHVCTAADAHEHCVGAYCSCPLLERVPLGALVEVVLVDESESKCSSVVRTCKIPPDRPTLKKISSTLVPLVYRKHVRESGHLPRRALFFKSPPVRLSSQRKTNPCKTYTAFEEKI